MKHQTLLSLNEYQRALLTIVPVYNGYEQEHSVGELTLFVGDWYGIMTEIGS
jgi:hypothetical protein